MTSFYLVNAGSGDGLSQDSTESLSEPIFTWLGAVLQYSAQVRFTASQHATIVYGEFETYDSMVAELPTDELRVLIHSVFSFALLQPNKEDIKYPYFPFNDVVKHVYTRKSR